MKTNIQHILLQSTVCCSCSPAQLFVNWILVTRHNSSNPTGIFALLHTRTTAEFLGTPEDMDVVGADAGAEGWEGICS